MAGVLDRPGLLKAADRHNRAAGGPGDDRLVCYGAVGRRAGVADKGA